MAPSTWPIVAVVFISLFLLVSLGSALIVGYLRHSRAARAGGGPPGSARCADAERQDAARAMARLEAHLAVQEQYNAEADALIALLERQQKQLAHELRDARRRVDAEPMDLDIFRRLYEQVHQPLAPPRPSLPPLVVHTTAATPTPPTPPSPTEVAKLRGVMRSNSHKGPAATTRVVPGPAASYDSLEMSAMIVKPTDEEAAAGSEPPAVGRKPENYQAR